MASYLEEELHVLGEDTLRDALCAEINLYVRILAWRDMRCLKAGLPLQDALAARIDARLRAAQRLYNLMDDLTYNPLA